MISCTQIKTLPEGIETLVELQELFLAHNQLTTLPKDLGNLSKLYSIFVCPILSFFDFTLDG